MIPLSYKKAGLRNLLFHFPRLAYYVLVSFEGGDPAEEAKLAGDLEDVGRYVNIAVRNMEREVLQEVLESLASDGNFAEAVYRDLASDVLQRGAEHWEAVGIFAKFLYGELDRYSSLAKCMELDEFKSLCDLAGISLDALREIRVVFLTWDSVTGKYMACSPLWLKRAVEQISNSISIGNSEEALKLIEDFITKLFNNPRGYAAVRSDVFKDIPIIPLDIFLGQVVDMPGVFNGRRVNPVLREAVKKAIFKIESGRAPGGELDPDFGVYVEGERVYAPVPEAVGHKVVSKYQGSRIVALARWQVEIDRYAPYLAPYGVTITVLEKYQVHL